MFEWSPNVGWRDAPLRGAKYVGIINRAHMGIFFSYLFRVCTNSSAQISPVNSIRDFNFTNDDIYNVKQSISTIFSIYSPGYTEERMTNNIGLETTPLIYFYDTLIKIYNIKFENIDVSSLSSPIYVTNSTTNTTNIYKAHVQNIYTKKYIILDVVSCIIDCLEQPPAKWEETINSYNLTAFINKHYHKIREVLIETIEALLLESNDSEIIFSWKKMYRAIFYSCITHV